MRLFRRRDEDAEATPDREGPASGAPAATTDDGVARQTRQPSGDWMTLSPLAPSFKAMPTTFRVQTFPEILTSHTDTRLSGGSLGHAVSADGPSGSVGGLATQSGDVSPVAGMGELPLREPHHAPAPEEPAIEVRRLADPFPVASTAPTAGTISTAAAALTPIVSRLPEPTVSRSLLDTAPLVAPRPSERPLPVARVVDSPAASSPASAPPAAAPQLATASDDSDSTDSSEPIDTRVGGFGVPLDGGAPIVFDPPVDDDTPRMAAPLELAPPIQPRRIQRALDPSASRQHSADAPLVGDAPAATAGADLSTTNPDPTPAPRGGELPLVAPPSTTAAPVLPVSRLADPGVSSGGGSSSSDSTGSGVVNGGDSSSDSGPNDSGPGSDRGLTSDIGASTAHDGSTAETDSLQTTPLIGAAPSISASSVIAETPATDDTPASAELPLRAPAVAPSTSASGLEAPIQRLADTTTTPSPASGAATERTAGLVGGSPLVETTGDGDADTSDDADAPAPTSGLPLVAPVVQTAPTVGHDPMVHVQPMAEHAGAQSPTPSPGTAGLPLAPPSDLGGALTPPVPRTAPDVQRLPEASAAESTRPLVSLVAPSASSPSAPSLQRSVGTTSPSSSSLAAASTGALPFVRPVGPGRSIGATSSSPMAMLSTPTTSGATASMPVQLRRLDDADDFPAVTMGDAAHGEGGSASLPLAPVQRLDGGSTADTATGSAGPSSGPAPSSELPLHTPAASIPSAADIAVRAGLAERGPDGSLFYTTAAPAATSFVVQREAEGSGGDDTPVQTLTIGGHRASAAGAPGRGALAGGLGSAGGASGGATSEAPAPAGGDAATGGGGGNDAAATAKDLSAEAKKLYPFIRSALEADIRRQIEGKSRASRFRP